MINFDERRNEIPSNAACRSDTQLLSSKLYSSPATLTLSSFVVYHHHNMTMAVPCLTVLGESLLVAGLGISLLAVCLVQASVYQGLPLEQLGMLRFVAAHWQLHSCSSSH
jgi:hypothetical protein